ncbi:dihydropteroate synthase [Corynebacterium anserum]|nr:dihydropteroate synthase [Corynebacterium anserum]
MQNPQPRAQQPTQVMGILNVTDDSFSDGGKYPDTPTAVAHAVTMVGEGADIIDIGGESTRPGATRVEVEQEMARVVPVIHELNSRGIVTSVDTMRASTAAAGIDAGASIINDVSGGLADNRMLAVAADTGAKLCLMHWNAKQFQGAEGYRDHGQNIVAHVKEWLLRRVDAALSAGVEHGKIILDPGIGFAKSPQDNWALLHATGEFVELGLPVLIGVSRKRFLTALRPNPDGTPGIPESADDATAAVSALSAAAGAWGVRVHSVAPSRAAVDVAYSWAMGTGPDVPESWRARRRGNATVTGHTGGDSPTDTAS